MSVLNKIKKAELVGRGGACYPVWRKWQAVKEAFGEKKHVVCNASEGEPGVEKDGYIIEHWPEKVIDGIKIAIDFLSAEKGYFYINHKYYKKYGKKLKQIIGSAPIEIFVKPVEAGYIGGEEFSVLNAIEGKRVEPRMRPPFPTTKGLWGFPTLINNVETFYNVSLVISGEYRDARFYTLSGDCLNGGVYELPAGHTINKILKETENYPRFSFFVQVGGNASGEVLNSSQLNRKTSGSGSIAIYSIQKTSVKKLIKSWLEFFVAESCGQCTPCREGIYRLSEEFNLPKPDWRLCADLLNNLEEASFCGLGCAVPIPIKSFVKNVLPQLPEKKFDLPGANKNTICDCFK